MDFDSLTGSWQTHRPLSPLAGSTSLNKPDLGTKRVCPSCAARFYDLQKRPIECPKCAFAFEPEMLLKQRRTRVPEPIKPVVAAEAEDEEAEETEDEEVEEAVTEDEAEEEVVEAEPVVEADAEAEGEEGEPAAAEETTEAEEFEEEIEDEEEEDDNLLEEVEEDEDDVSGIIDADIEKDEP
jgi:uncharacterized protein (TIGR02300 family)